MWTTCRHGHAHWGQRGAAGLLLARDGRVLMQLRAGWAHRGGTWSIPGGARERGETPTEAALREAAEEFGIDPDVVGVHGSRPWDCGGWNYETILATARGAVVVELLSESTDHAWATPEEVDALHLHPGFASAWDDPDGVLRGFVAATA